jgi:hypothetical protein
VYTLTVATDHDFFVGSDGVLVHNSDVLCGQVAYGSTELSRAVQYARILSNDKKGNYAAALLDDGTIIIGRSGPRPLHAEENLITRAGQRRIVALYSEREPCQKKCMGLVQGINVTWSWPWNGADRDATNAALNAALKELFK